LAILEIFGDLYFGAVSHIEKAVSQHLAANPDQRFLLLRMHSVDHCDFSGIHALEAIVRSCREQGGDVFMVRVHESIVDLMGSTGSYDYLGEDHFLTEDDAIPYLYHKILDPAICIYECDVRVFQECQNLPKCTYPVGIPCYTEIPAGSVPGVSPQELWHQLHAGTAPLIVDVREPREYERGHVPQARLMSLPALLSEALDLPHELPVVFVCRGGRRSTRAAYMLRDQGYENVTVLRGGMLAWEAAGLLEALGEGAH
jgi:SulP family sulfate permease